MVAVLPRVLPIFFLGKKVFQRWKFTFPTLEILNSYLGTEKFLRWNRKVPPLELESSSVGTKKFQEGNSFWNSYVLRNQHDVIVAEEATA